MAITKESYRKECLGRLKRVKKQNKYYRDALINRYLLQLFKGSKNKNILGYLALDMEADITKALRLIRKKNNLFVPLMEDVSFKIVPFRLPLSRKKFNIYEAGNSNKIIKNIDVAIIPAVGVDIKARRIGYGKGMYDRFFSNTKKNPYKIFIQSQICYIKENICDDFDISCDMLITPRVTLLRKRESNVNRNTVKRIDSHSKRNYRFFNF